MGQNRWLTGEEILARWQGLDFELVKAFMDGIFVSWEHTFRLEPYSKTDGKRPFKECMSCQFGTFDGWPGEHRFHGSAGYACSPEPVTNCCYAALPINVLADKLKLHWFKRIEVEEYERLAEIHVVSDDQLPGEQNPNLLPQERQELGRLRLEKEKWDVSIQAAVIVGTHTALGHRLTKPQVWELLKEHSITGDDLPDTTFAKIWAAIPTQFRNTGGRPKGSGNADA